MTWTMVRPQVPGWYWFKDRWCGATPVHVIAYEASESIVLCVRLPLGKDCRVNDVEGEWSSAPLAPPREA